MISFILVPARSGPRSSSPKFVRFVIFDWKNDLYWTGENDWGKESDARIYSSLHQVLVDMQLMKQWQRWPPPDSWN